MGRFSSRRTSPIYVNPSPELSPSLSDIEDWDAETAMDLSRPPSWVIPRTGSPFINPPTLQDILTDTAPQPWTLSAFMAYLSQNHCLETLEFILDAGRYRAAYSGATRPGCFGVDHLCALWEKIIEAYIVPGSPREVNIPYPVRDHLIQLSCSPASPASPAELDEAVHIVRELMNDSVLVPFLESVVPVTVEAREEENLKQRTRLRIPKESSASPLSPDDTVRSPISTLLPLLGKRNPTRSYSGSSDSNNDVDMTDDSASPGSSPAGEPMTPPTTPPTSSRAFDSSPKPRVSGSSWRKMGAKFGLGKRNKSRSNTSAVDVQPPHPAQQSQSTL
ncbi:RGS domain-containing protein [Xylariaceae sp. FL1272]|nr:RGS domain-containing protein [Xylariaceae sp. FL1272]